MRIGVVAPSAVPYVRGGYERLCTGLVDHFNENTEHEAELFKLPFPETNVHEVVDGYRRFSSLDDLGVDMVITGKYPAWCIDHPNHVVYMAHPLRGLYDTYPSHLGTAAHPDADHERQWLDGIGPGDSFTAVFERFDRLVDQLGADHPAFAYPGPLARAVVHALDRIALAPGRIRRYAAISGTVAARPNYFPAGARVAVAHTPSNLVPAADAGPRSGLFTASRFDQPKRLHLLVQAMRQVRAGVTLQIAGTGPEAERLLAMAADDHRVEFLGFVSDEELTAHYARAIAVPFVPADEDLGLIAIEAMASGAVVLTTSDSGGPAELVRDGVNGLVVEPAPAALAEAIDRLAASPTLTARLACAGRETAARITWSATADRLLGTVGSSVPTRVASPVRTSGRPRIVALSTYNIQPAMHGGQLRCLHLFGALAETFDVTVLCLVEPGAPFREVEGPAGFTEIHIPRSQAHSAVEWERSAEAGIPMGDLYGGEFIGLTPAYLDAAAADLQGAAAAFLAQPYMLPCIERLGIPVPSVYDSQNCEQRLKSDALPTTTAADRVRAAVADVERRAIAGASLLSVCSRADEIDFERLYGQLPLTHFAPNGVDLHATRYVQYAERAHRRERWIAGWRYHSDGLHGPAVRDVALFIGSWHPPNLDAARAVHELAAERPDVMFVMVGGHTLAFRSADLPPNVVQLGVISDLTKRTLLSLASVALNPMLSGSGTNLKLVEYLAAGVPTVSTRHGARGIVDEDGICTIADGPDLAAAVAGVLAQSPDLSDAVTARARRFVADRFDWRHIGRSLSAAVVEGLGIDSRAIVE